MNEPAGPHTVHVQLRWFWYVIFRLNRSSTQMTPTVSSLCFSWYTVVGRRCPAHPASVPILHLTDTRTLWSQQFEKEIPGTTLQLYKQNKQCNAMPSYWILKRSPYAHQQPTCIDREKNDAQRWKQRRANKKWKKQKNDKKPKHGEICTYVPRRSK